MDEPERWRPLAPEGLRCHLELLAEQNDSRNEARHLRQIASAVRGREYPAAVGEAMFPVVLPAGPIEGFIVSVRADGRGGRPLPDPVKRTVRQALAAVAGAPAPPPTWVNIALKTWPVTPGISIEGESLQLACAVALASALTGVAPLESWVLSGRLAWKGDGPVVEPIDHTEQKGRIAALEAPDARPRIVNEAAPLGEELKRALGPTIVRELQEAAEVSPDLLAHAAFDAMRGGRFEEARQTAGRALAGLPGPLGELKALWTRGACLLHAGRDAEGSADLERARALASSVTESLRRVPRFLLEELEAQLGIALIDTGRPAAACVRLERAMSSLDGAGGKDTWWEEVRLQVAGSLHRALVAAGRLQEAQHVLERSLEETEGHAERARILGDLAEVYRRAGKLSDARSTLRQSRRWLRDIPAPQLQRNTKRFLRLFEIRAGIRAASPEAPAPLFGDYPQPAFVLESLIQGSPRRLDEWFDLHVPERATPPNLVFLQVYLGALARAALLHGSASRTLRRLASMALEHHAMEAGMRSVVEGLMAGSEDSARAWERRCPY